MASEEAGAAPAANGAEQGAPSAADRLIWAAAVLIGHRVEVQVSTKGLEQLRGAAGRPWPPQRAAGGTVLPPAPQQPRPPPEELTRGPSPPAQTLDGVVYEGVFNCMKLADGARHVVLRYAKVVRDPTLTAEGLQELATRPEEVKVIMSADLAGVVAKDVRLAPEDLGSEAYGDVSFETDAAISRGRGG